MGGGTGTGGSGGISSRIDMPELGISGVYVMQEIRTGGIFRTDDILVDTIATDDKRVIEVRKNLRTGRTTTHETTPS